MLPCRTPTAPTSIAAPCLPLLMPWPPGSTPTMRTCLSLMNGQKRPIALEPPPTHATSRSGSRPMIFFDWARVSSPITRWKSRTIIG